MRTGGGSVGSLCPCTEAPPESTSAQGGCPPPPKRVPLLSLRHVLLSAAAVRPACVERVCSLLVKTWCACCWRTGCACPVVPVLVGWMVHAHIAGALCMGVWFFWPAKANADPLQRQQPCKTLGGQSVPVARVRTPTHEHTHTHTQAHIPTQAHTNNRHTRARARTPISATRCCTLCCTSAPLCSAYACTPTCKSEMACCTPEEQGRWV